MINPGIFSSASNEWQTPNDLFNKLDNIYHFTLDPCSTDQNAKCEKHFTINNDGLSQSWENERVFMNPPYGRKIGNWIKKASDESEHALVVCLIPARTDVSYWHEFIFNKAKIIFLKGRINFVRSDGKSGPAPFPSAVIIFDKNLRNDERNKNDSSI